MKPQPNKSKPSTTKPKPTPSVPGNSQVDKNSKESFIKKLHLCSKIYDYKDETKDVKGKTERLNAVQELQQMLSDQKNVT